MSLGAEQCFQGWLRPWRRGHLAPAAPTRPIPFL
ncbi:hypothetical protein STRTUCAR8_07409, partial [Streptomyces turgidiscabies Car8]